MATLPSASVDLVLTDPPYGISACKWDSVIPFDAMWEQLWRIAKPDAAVVLFGGEPFSSALRMSDIENYKYDWKWEKPNAANFLNFKYQPAKVHEDIIVFGRMATSYSKRGNLRYYPQMEPGEPYIQKSGNQKHDYGNASVRSPIKTVVTNNSGERYPRSILRFGGCGKKVHQTQKPVELLSYIIKTYTLEGDTVLDFTMGSGSTGVACANTNRKFIGIELSEEYFNLAKDRVGTAYEKATER